MQHEQEFESLEQTLGGVESLTHKGRFWRPLDTALALKTMMWQELKLSKLIGGWIPAIESYDRKVRLGRHAYLHNRNAKFMYERITELPGGLKEGEWIPDALNEMFERLFAAPDEVSFFISYSQALRWMHVQYGELMKRLDPILNAPTVDQLSFVFLESNSIAQWVESQLQFAHTEHAAKSDQMAEWEKYGYQVWQAYENAHTTGNACNKVAWPAHIASNALGPLPEKVRLEPRFPKYENANPTQSYSDATMSVLYDSVKQMIYIYAAELFAGETLSSIYYYVDRMPLPFYWDLARHMWDEFRHSQMGMRRLEQMGYSVDQFKWLGGPNREDVKERFTELYSALTMTGEACGFKKKRKSAEAFWKFGDVLSAVTVEFDLIDERRHIEFATRWGPELFRLRGVIVSFQEMAEQARLRRLTELQSVPPDEMEKLAKNFPVFCGFHTSELAYDRY